MKKAAREFARYWEGKGYEKGESQAFWLSLLRDVFGIEHPEQYVRFEEQVKIDKANGFIDVMIPSTKVMIEQKGANKDLRMPIKQSDGTLLNPFQQAKRYIVDLPLSEHPRWVITCNFKEFLIYDMEKPTGEPESILLSELEKEYYRLAFIVEEKDEILHRELQVSIEAGRLVGRLYDAILKQYRNPENEETLKSLNVLCVRLVFCLYAEDAGIFGGHSKFHNYIKSLNIRDVRRGLIDLFRVLDTKIEERDPYLDDDLAAFPYVNGGLFANENIEIPNFTQEIIDLLLENASEGFDWSQISPTIFGAVFESTLNPETRRSGGMHYTSIENIHKVIDPLFLDELKEEFETIKELKVAKTRKDRAEAFREKLASLTFFDPACGSGNFLTETYISLRRLENEALSLCSDDGQIGIDTGDIIKVSIGQFYGIEINDFAVTVAKTALWIAESQMMKATEQILATSLDFLPLKTYDNIYEGNALRVDWETVVPKDKLNYIMGNPPFVGSKFLTAEQRDDISSVYFGCKNSGIIDYVSGWFYKAANMIHSTNIRVAFVSTNSITQGEQVAAVWKPLYDRFNIHIDFAHRTFKWGNEANAKALVYCIIVGFSNALTSVKKHIYDDSQLKEVNNINAYLIEADNIFVESRTKPICNVPEIGIGNQPIDGGFYLFSAEEMLEFIKNEPKSATYFRPWMGANEFLYNKKRFCLWLGECSPSELRSMPLCLQRVAAVNDFRLTSKRKSTLKLAETPTRFQVENFPTDNYILIPEATISARRYIPMGFLTPEIICSNLVKIIPNGTIYHFGVLTSNVHMAWMRATCGYYGPSYRYSKDIVYNNFPWPTPTEAQKTKIEQTAQAILDARALYPDCSLADLYDEVAMPPELRKAHQANDKAVMQAYGFDVKTMTESSCVAELMNMYQQLV